MPADGNTLADWDFTLPPHHIAAHPRPDRADSRLLVLNGTRIERHAHFRELGSFLKEGDLLVGNNTRVMAARLHARRATGGRVELLLLEPGPGAVKAMVRPLKKLKIGENLAIEGGGVATLEARLDDGLCRVSFDGDPQTLMQRAGAMPLPPYIDRPASDADSERYQTVYAGPLGASAAPTAGLHFTQSLLDQLARDGIGFATVTLHVGLGTFRPLREADIERGTLHAEPYSVPQATVDAIRATRDRGGRVIAIGTTTVRTLESATPAGARVPNAGSDDTQMFIQPGYAFRCVDGLITNFHLPRSSLLMLVAAKLGPLPSGREALFAAYREAIAHDYRFYSYGDAMLLL